MKTSQVEDCKYAYKVTDKTTLSALDLQFNYVDYDDPDSFIADFADHVIPQE